MTPSTPIPPGELERLLDELDAGKHDEQLAPPPAAKTPTKQLGRFSDVKPFDVRMWANRKGIKLPDS